MNTASRLFFIIAAGMMTGKAFAVAQLPQAVSRWVIGMHLTPMMFLVVCALVMLVLGTAFDAALSPYILGFMLFPTAVALGISPIQFCIWFMLGGLVAAVMPPVATSLFFCSSQFHVPYAEVTRGAMPFLTILIAVWALVTLFPILSTWLPSLLGMK